MKTKKDGSRIFDEGRESKPIQEIIDSLVEESYTKTGETDPLVIVYERGEAPRFATTTELKEMVPKMEAFEKFKWLLPFMVIKEINNFLVEMSVNETMATVFANIPEANGFKSHIEKEWK